MKFTIQMLAVLVLLLATFGPQAEVSADMSRFKGHDAFAHFSHIDPSGCIRTSILLEAGEDTLYSILVYQSNHCQAQTLLEAYGHKPLTKSEMKYSGDLKSATLTTSVHVTDFERNLDFDVFIDLTWTGTGDINSYHDHYNYWPSPGCHVNLQLSEEHRRAIASGTVSDGTVNFTPEPATSADLYFGKRIETSQGCP